MSETGWSDASQVDSSFKMVSWNLADFWMRLNFVRFALLTPARLSQTTRSDGSLIFDTLSLMARNSLCSSL